jgi:photosystem II stability/assembly factor-like uncharacterized protein
MKIFRLNILIVCFFISTTDVFSQSYDPSLFNCMKWRMIGPFRGGRTVGASGNAKQPNVFYIGVNNGGVWKTTDYGRTWFPVFDDQPTGSIGDVAVAPSNPETIYAASGEGLQRPDLSEGDGMYKSIDGGKSWIHQGLSEALQIGGLSIDPKDENRVFAAVLGHPYGPNKERGVYRTTDGGKTWEKVLYTDENTGAIQVLIDPTDPKIVYADLWAGRLAPWENGEWSGPGSGLFKSTDGGTTWKKLTTGLPSYKDGLDRIGFCMAPSDHNRMYALVSANEKSGGFYRSDDGGESWKKINSDIRLWDRGTDFAELKVDPKNEDLVFDANVVVWKSADAGKTWIGFKGAPGGDDYHRLWINPDNSNVILLASDQGALITVNGGITWSSWYNQPTAQLYHVSADNAFPYHVYSGQQESGSVGISSRGSDGAITFRDWHPVGAEEYGYVVADPLDPDIIYGGKISKYNKRTGQTQDISPDAIHSNNYRFIRTAPIVFSPIDHKTLFFAGNVLFKTQNGGNSWKVISPDLTRKTYDFSQCIGIYLTDEMKKMAPRGVIYSIALSPLDSNVIWIGTDDGLMQRTIDGGATWTNITPPTMTSWSKISMMEASHTDKNTAYAAVNKIRLDDQKPHILKTTDGGKTWNEIVNGLGEDPINTVKEDPEKKGLLFAGSERAVYVSFDDGAHWQSLRLNMPASSMRDLVIKDNDLIVATHGRSFWILDDITPLRQLSSSLTMQPAALYKPATAWRVRWNLNTDTPLPPEEPVGKNPPDGAVLDYYLKEKINSEITLDISDSTGKLIRHFSSLDTMYKIPDVNIPLYWIRPQQILSGEAGAHRFLWDMHLKPMDVRPSYPISAIVEDTPPNATSPWVLPGNYTVQLTVNGKIDVQPLHIEMDPRVIPDERERSLDVQYSFSKGLYDDMMQATKTMKEIISMITQLKTMEGKGTGAIVSKMKAQENKLTQFVRSGESGGTKNLATVNEAMQSAFNVLQGADEMPTMQSIDAATVSDKEFKQRMAEWELHKKEILDLNVELKKVGLMELKME